MPIPTSLQPELATTVERLTRYFTDFLHAQTIPDKTLQEAIAYALLNGGKRMRPLLVNLVGEMLSLDESEVTPIALAIECMHAYSLVHDDLPAMDDDDLRRGNPTCHVKFDEATAILAGDALQCMSFEILASANFNDFASSQKANLVMQLCQSAGASGMVGGQSLDLAATNSSISIDQLKRLHALKTGALLTACVALPCIVSPDISDNDKLTLLDFATHIGLAFQIQDDILDVTADTETLGKPQGSDQDANKSTFVSLLGLQGAKKELNQQHQLAIQALRALPYNADKLISFTDFIVTRTY